MSDNAALMTVAGLSQAALASPLWNWSVALPGLVGERSTVCIVHSI